MSLGFRSQLVGHFWRADAGHSSEAPKAFMAAVLRKNFIRTLGRDFLKPIFMVESAENGGASNHVSGRNTMSVSRLLRGRT